MKGYAILEERENLKLLCLRGGFSIEQVLNSNNNFLGENLSDHIKKELCISNIKLGIDNNKKYKFYELELKTLPLYLNNFFKFLRTFTGGILITCEK
ncbi:hypothetical protein NRK67_13920 [Fusobacteria bacterium ZRK30]|nr:hypothetical protein NRK67_13920 [Fusobacteria bacterium ZRK30]